ncbi:MAG: hypothetical protein AAGA60_28910 [Cyanobacteria bacterium P01_E01_bin.42]
MDANQISEMLIERKKIFVVEILFRRAVNSLPSPNRKESEKFGRLISEYKQHLKNKDFYMAFLSIIEAGNLVPARGGFWKDLERAAKTLKG